MKKLIFLTLIIVNLAVIGIVLSRRWLGPDSVETADSRGDPPATSAEGNSTVDATAMHIELPPRPRTLSHEPADASAKQIWRLRVAAFDVAEDAVKRLGGASDAWCLLGKLHLRSGNEAEAKAIWTRVTQQDPAFAEAHLDLGVSALNNADYPAAQAHFEESLKHSPESRDAMLKLADALVKQGKAAPAIGIIDELLGKEENNSQLWCLRGGADQVEADWAQAVVDYNTALSIELASREAVQGLMVAYRQQGDMGQASAMAQRLAEIEAALSRTDASRNVQERDQRVARELLVFTAQTAADAYQSRELVSTTQQMLRGPLALVPDSTQLRTLSSRLYFQSRQFDSAIKTLQQLCDAAPDSPDNWLLLAETCILSRRMDPAETALRKAIEIEPDRLAAYRMLAEVSMFGGRNPDQAIRSAQKVLELSPVADSHYILGTALYHAGKKSEAVVHLRKAVKMSPEKAEFKTALANIESEL